LTACHVLLQRLCTVSDRKAVKGSKVFEPNI